MALNEMGEDWDSRELLGLDDVEPHNGSELLIYHPPCAAPVADIYARRLLWEICSPVILAVGIVGNILVLVVMTRRRMRGTSTSVYLVAMAILDLIVLMAGLLPHWLAGAKYVVLKDLHPVSCKVEKFLDYTSGDAAVWVRVAFTIDRFVAVLFPLYTGRCCGRPRAARGYIVAATVAAAFKNFHIFWTCGAERYTCMDSTNGTLVTNIDNCIYPEPYRNFEMFIRPWITFVLVSAAPFILIAVCNTLIILALVMRQRNMKTIRRSVSNGGKNEQFVQMAVMCVAASMMFLVCNLPTIIILIGRPRWTGGQNNSVTHAIVKAAFNLLFYVTFSANFFIYCMTGGRFRSTLRQCCGGSATRRYSVNDDSEPMSRNNSASPRRQTSSGPRSVGGGGSGSFDTLSTSPTWLPVESKDLGTENGTGKMPVTGRRLQLLSKDVVNADKMNGVKGHSNGRVGDKLHGDNSGSKRTERKNEKEICQFILTVV